jgi:hypothetical protein
MLMGEMAMTALDRLELGEVAEGEEEEATNSSVRRESGVQVARG